MGPTLPSHLAAACDGFLRILPQQKMQSLFAHAAGTNFALQALTLSTAFCMSRGLHSLFCFLKK